LTIAPDAPGVLAATCPTNLTAQADFTRATIDLNQCFGVNQTAVGGGSGDVVTFVHKFK
jgi:hypothetical protein